MPNSSSQSQASVPGQTSQVATINSSSPNSLPSTPPAPPNSVEPPTAIPLLTSQGISRPPLTQNSSSDTQSLQQQQHVPSNTAQSSLNISRYSNLLKRVMAHPLGLCIALAALALTVKGLYLDTYANELSEKAIQLAEEANRLAIEESCRNHPVSSCPVKCSHVCCEACR